MPNFVFVSSNWGSFIQQILLPNYIYYFYSFLLPQRNLTLFFCILTPWHRENEIEQKNYLKIQQGWSLPVLAVQFDWLLGIPDIRYAIANDSLTYSLSIYYDASINYSQCKEE